MESCVPRISIIEQKLQSKGAARAKVSITSTRPAEQRISRRAPARRARRRPDLAVFEAAGRRRAGVVAEIRRPFGRRGPAMWSYPTPVSRARANSSRNVISPSPRTMKSTPPASGSSV